MHNSAIVIGGVTVAYLVIAYAEWKEGKPGMGVAFLGYAFANVGLIIEGMR